MTQNTPLAGSHAWIAPVLVVALVVIVAGCGSRAADEAPATIAQPIKAGTVDTQYPAVVVLRGPRVACTATVIHVTGEIGAALTAAHCVSERIDSVLVGEDLDHPRAEHPVIEVIRHPAFDGGRYDFAIVRFGGATADTPVIPVLSRLEDTLAPGSALTFVGYSWKVGAAHPRVSAAGVVAEVDATLLRYDQSDGGGPCHGDSGGPAIVVTREGPRVAAVTSYGDASCASYGASGRVSAVVESFIAPNLEASRGPLHDCAECRQGAGSGACAADRARCEADPRCAELSRCVDACADGRSCMDACRERIPDGLDAYLRVEQCTCGSACPSECEDSPRCAKPACGVRSPWLSCQACLEGSCCAEGARCAADATCAACARGDGDASACEAAAGTSAVSRCLASRCEQECRGVDLLPNAPRYHVARTDGGESAGCSVRRPSRSSDGGPPSGSGMLVVVVGGALALRLRARGRSSS